MKIDFYHFIDEINLISLHFLCCINTGTNNKFRLNTRSLEKKLRFMIIFCWSNVLCMFYQTISYKYFNWKFPNLIILGIGNIMHGNVKLNQELILSMQSHYAKPQTNLLVNRDHEMLTLTCAWSANDTSIFYLIQ